MKKQLLALMICLVPGAAAHAEDTQKARVITHKGDVTKCLVAVQIRMIDGKLRNLPSLGFEVEPGLRRLSGEVNGSTHHCGKPKRRSRKPLMGFPAVEWLFEPGMVYYVAMNHMPEFHEDWHLVIWKVTSEDGEVVFDITKQEPQP